MSGKRHVRLGLGSPGTDGASRPISRRTWNAARLGTGAGGRGYQLGERAEKRRNLSFKLFSPAAGPSNPARNERVAGLLGDCRFVLSAFCAVTNRGGFLRRAAVAASLAGCHGFISVAIRLSAAGCGDAEQSGLGSDQQFGQSHREKNFG